MASTAANVAMTAGGTAAATQIEPVVAWFTQGCPLPVPQEVNAIVAVALVALGHVLWQLYSGWRTRNFPQQEETAQ